MSQIDYYREQAGLARSLAEKSKLPNVRARFLESEESWMRFVARAERLQAAQPGRKGATGRSDHLL
jgi:hypothetical protein